jgi:hypothetical protein
VDCFARNYRAGLLAVMLCALISSPCFAVDFQCPASIEVTQQIVEPPASWQALSDQARGGYHLDNVGFYNGHPKNKGAVVPDKTTRAKGLAKTTWLFPQKKSADFWISCSYTDTSIMLTQQLSSGLSYCEVTSELLPSGSTLRIKSIICQ